jgi:phage terminase small subunit
VLAVLRAKQQRFVDEYLRDLNATQAAIRAGYSAKRADEQGYENLRKPEIVAAINAAKQRRAKRTEITADRVLEESARLAFLDIRQLYDDDGTLKPVSQWPDEVAAAVSGIDSVQQYEQVGDQMVPAGVLKKIRLWSKPSQLTLLAKHLKLLQEDAPKTIVNVQINVRTSLAEALQHAYGSSSGTVDRAG